MIPGYISIHNSASNSLTHFLGKNAYSKIGILVDEHTNELCYPKIAQSLSEHTRFTIKSGESEKTLATCGQIWDWLTDMGFDRNSLLVNLGGGVIGDMGGFCASCFKRGIDFVHIPTTLLAQVDASIGGKLGVDFRSYKNHIGIFRFPESVIVDPDFLLTLPEKELNSGFAEVIKHAIINDSSHFEELESISKLKSVNWLPIIRKSLEIKSEIVEKDPKESGLRKILNFGHTIGHAIEAAFLEKGEVILHGEAVAVGMICESFLSTKITSLSSSQHERVTRMIQKYFDHRDLHGLATERLNTILLQDKKNKDNKMLFTLLEDIGKAVYDIEVREVDVMEALEYYKNLRALAI